MIHLLGGWIGVHSAGLAREIGQCCARLELDINKLTFKFKDDREIIDHKYNTDRMESLKNLQNKNKNKKNSKHNFNQCDVLFCSKRDTFITYGNLLIPYIVFISSNYMKFFVSRFRTFARLYTPFVLSLSVIGYGVEYNYETYPALEIYFLIMSDFIIVYTLYSLILFASVIAFDFRRRYYSIYWLTKLLQPGKYAFYEKVRDPTFQDGKLRPEPHLFPNDWLHNYDVLINCKLETLDLTDATTIYNWSRLRAFFLDFGLRFLRREEAILSVFACQMLLLCLFYFSMLYFEIIEPSIWSILSVFFAAFGVFVPCFISLRFAEQINHKLRQQRSILADKRLRIAHEMYHLDELENNESGNGNKNWYKTNKKLSKQMFENLTKASEMMTQVIRLLEYEKFRIRVLGYEIDTTVTGIFAFVLGSVGFACARLLTSEF